MASRSATAGVETVALNFIGASRELPETEDDTDPLLRNYLGYLDDQPANIVEAVRRLAAPDAPVHRRNSASICALDRA